MARGNLPPVVVSCTGCGEKFESAARDHTKCPTCHRNLRIHRPGHRRPVIVQAHPDREYPVRQTPVRQTSASPPVAVAPPIISRPPIIGPSDDDDGDDGYAYVRGPDGRLVLGEQKDGCVVPAIQLPVEWLADQLDARRWTLRPHGQGICQVERMMYVPANGDLSAARWLECPYRTAYDSPAVCATHWTVLASPAG
jgi:hypothetical protein